MRGKYHAFKTVRRVPHYPIQAETENAETSSRKNKRADERYTFEKLGEGQTRP